MNWPFVRRSTFERLAAAHTECERLNGVLRDGDRAEIERLRRIIEDADPKQLRYFGELFRRERAFRKDAADRIELGLWAIPGAALAAAMNHSIP